MTHPMLDLEQFAKNHPPHDYGEGPWRERASHELFIRASTRVRLTIDEPAELGFGLARHEVLADAGIYSAEADSKSFAERLNATLGQQLSIRNLDHLIEVFTRARAEAEALRQDSIRRSQPAPGPDVSRPAQ
jgi:hypothetical protein